MRRLVVYTGKWTVEGQSGHLVVATAGYRELASLLGISLGHAQAVFQETFDKWLVETAKNDPGGLYFSTTPGVPSSFREVDNAFA